MKILHVIPSMEIGGAQRLLVDLLPIQNEYADVSLLVIKRFDNEFEHQIKDAGIHIYFLNAGKFYSLKNIPKLIKMTAGYDILHVHLTPAIYEMAIASLFCDRCMVLTEHSTSGRLRNYPIARTFEKMIYNRYKKIISISKESKYSLLRWLKEDNEDKYPVIENGVNLSIYKNIKHVNNNKNLIMVSRFAPAKDQYTVIRALKYLPDDIVVTFVGDGPRLEECKQLAKNLRLEDRVNFLGYRTDIPELIAKAYIGIQSSNWEGFGLSTVEIMAAELPVIASDVDGLREVVEGAGLLFEKGNEKDLANKIAMLIDNQKVYTKTKKLCIERALTYSIEETSNKYINLYKEIYDCK